MRRLPMEPGNPGTVTMFWRPLADGVAVAVKVQPKSRRPGVQGLAPSADGERLRIGVTEPAEDGRANRAACAALAEALGSGAIRGASHARRDQPGKDAARHRRSRGARREAGRAVTARIIDGKAVAAALRARLARQVATLPFRPGLAVVLVGDDPASAIYVRSKDRAARAVGIAAHTIRLPADTSEEALLDADRPTERRSGGGRHPGAAAAARAYRRAGGDRGDRSGQGRGRLPPAECRPPG